MEDAFTLIVLTLLQLCRAEISNTEWFAANLINDPNYTPKPITEIFTTDITFIPKNPSISTQVAPNETFPPTISTTVPTTTGTRDITTQEKVTERVPQLVDSTTQQTQGSIQPFNKMPSVVLIYDPRQQSNLINQQLPISPTPVSSTPVTSFVTQALLTPSSSLPPPPPPPPALSQAGPTIVIKQPQNQSPNPQLIPIGLIPNAQNGNSIIPISNIPVVNDTSGLVTPTPVAASQQPETARRPSLTVRVKTPRGSITNIRINPTTTRRPSTTRRRKSSKRANDYEICLNSCNGRKEPICSSPMGVFPIDPDRLKGFASLCHMACHNTFRKDQVFNKVADGRCGRLRTRIRPLDQNKLNREDLNKAQYTITHNAPETVMEFSPLKR